jgi:hypothetical protein
MRPIWHERLVEAILLLVEGAELANRVREGPRVPDRLGGLLSAQQLRVGALEVARSARAPPRCEVARGVAGAHEQVREIVRCGNLGRERVRALERAPHVRGRQVGRERRTRRVGVRACGQPTRAGLLGERRALAVGAQGLGVAPARGIEVPEVGQRRRCEHRRLRFARSGERLLELGARRGRRAEHDEHVPERGVELGPPGGPGLLARGVERAAERALRGVVAAQGLLGVGEPEQGADALARLARGLEALGGLAPRDHRLLEAPALRQRRGARRRIIRGRRRAADRRERGERRREQHAQGPIAGEAVHGPLP